VSETLQVIDGAKRLLFVLAFAAAYLPLVVLELVLKHWWGDPDAQGSRGGPVINPLIHFRCRAASHQEVWSADSQPGSPLSFYDRYWAYCPAGLATGCQWEAVAPISLADLRRQRVGEEAETSEYSRAVPVDEALMSMRAQEPRRRASDED
jgi:hypothetical protein